jgi:hydrogenase expression/formation protein HypC
MCLAVPMQIISLSGFAARCEARGVQREVSLFLLEPGSVAAGDFVLVHVGYAIQSISTQDADASWALFDQITAGLDHQNA